MTSGARSAIVLTVIALVIAGLGLYRARAPDSPNQGPETESAEGLPALLDFGRGECLACQKMMPVLDALEQQHGERVAVRYLDLKRPENEARAKQLRVRVIPTQILLDGTGAEVGRHEGFWPLEEIERRLESLEWIPAR